MRMAVHDYPGVGKAGQKQVIIGMHLVAVYHRHPHPCDIHDGLFRDHGADRMPVHVARNRGDRRDGLQVREVVGVFHVSGVDHPLHSREDIEHLGTQVAVRVADHQSGYVSMCYSPDSSSPVQRYPTPCSTSM